MLRSPSPSCLAVIPSLPRTIPAPLPEVRVLPSDPHQLPRAIISNPVEPCWIKRAGRSAFLIQHERSFAANIDAGLLTAGELYRVDLFEKYDYPLKSPFFGYTVTIEPIDGNPSRNLVLNYYCYRGNDGEDHWAIASAKNLGCITYGDCTGCPGRWQMSLPEPKPPKYPKWRGY